MKNTNKGVISIFALLSMMFFLIFIMVAYNNVAQKGKTQIETEEILVEYYHSAQSADDIAVALDGGDIFESAKTELLKETAEQNMVNDTNKNKYVYSNGKIYRIQ